MSRKEELKIDRTKYDHLDNASLEDFIREFLDRNRKFNEEREVILKKGSVSSKKRVELFEKYRVFVGYRHNIPLNLPLEGNLPIYVSPTVAFRVFPKSQKGESEDIKRIDMEKERFVNEKPEQALWYNYSIGMNNKRSTGRHQADVNRLLRALLGRSDSQGCYDADTLLLRVNINAPKKKILKDVNAILGLYKTKGKKPLLKKWKYYLITYDLKTSNKKLTYDEIATILYEAYPDNKRTFDADTCRKNYRSASRLIKEGYKEYI